MGASPLQIRDRLGHEDIKTTLNTYGHLYPNTDQKMAEQLESEYREEIR
jgi:integrase